MPSEGAKERLARTRLQGEYILGGYIGQSRDTRQLPGCGGRKVHPSMLVERNASHWSLVDAGWAFQHLWIFAAKDMSKAAADENELTSHSLGDTHGFVK